jgi:DNA-binding IclR family transcriptional regulator
VRAFFWVLGTGVVRTPATLALTLQVGSRIPIATSAIGRAYLAGALETERNAIVRLALKLDESAGDALRESIARGLRDVEEYGCATSFGEWQPDVSGIAVTFRSSDKGPMHVINCGGPSSSLSKTFLLEDVRPRLLALAKKLAVS